MQRGRQPYISGWMLGMEGKSGSQFFFCILLLSVIGRLPRTLTPAGGVCNDTFKSVIVCEAPLRCHRDETLIKPSTEQSRMRIREP